MKALWHWLRAPDPHAVYLARALDLAELERRQRVIERGSGVPVFVTFNH
jgi:hypothetical protein